MNKNRAHLIRSMLITTIILTVTVSGQAQDGRVLTLDDYPQWRRITSTAISPDGSWMTFGYRPNEGNDTLHVELLDGDTRYEIPLGSGPAFSDDSRWLAITISQSRNGGGGGGRRGQGGAAGASGGSTRKVKLLELETGSETIYEDIARSGFSDDGRYFLVRKRQVADDADHSGADLIVIDLSSGVAQNIGNVAEYAFNDGVTLLAYTVDAAAGTGNGVYLMDLEAGTLKPLDTTGDRYARLTWNEEGTALAVLRGSIPEDMDRRENTLLAWTGIGERRQQLMVYDPAADAAFPEGMVLSELAGLRWNEGSTMLFTGVKEQRESVEESDDPQADVDVWHYRDVRVQSVQMRQAGRDRNFTWASVVHLDGPRFLRLAEGDIRSVTFTDDGRWGIGRDQTPYEGMITWGGSKADYYRIDTATGEKTLMVENLGRTMGISPDGDWYLYLQEEHVRVRNIETGAETDLTELSGIDFVNRQDDHPYELPAYGVAGWSENGRMVLLNHRFDIWALPLQGGEAVNLTGGNGEGEQIRFRLVRLDREEETIDLSEPMMLSAYGEWTKKSGYFRMERGGMPQPVIWEDRNIGRIVKAEHADRIIYTVQTFEQFPDYWVSGLDFSNRRQVTEANPQQSEYRWGRRILVDFENSRGVRLQATLALPAGYREGQRYPMLVYHYEKMSQQHHSYSMPTYDDRPHMSEYASDGYLVLQPDIVYVEGHPGDSAMDCVGSAVRKVIELGYADPARIGLQGHSWGGYQSSFMVTQTDLFAAVVTGAPPTNLVSFYNTLYKSSGTVQQGIMEVGQVRMGTTPFEDFDLYLSQSPIHHTGDITTPFLILHGTEDGAVDWMQGLEYYNMARRQGKEVILLSYPGEGHHLGRKENQIDFQIRMKQFFDHYLKGAEAPAWMTDGVSFLEKGQVPPN